MAVQFERLERLNMAYTRSASWWAIVILATVLTTPHSVRASDSSRGNDEAEQDRRIIGQFYNYVDVIKGIKLDNMLKRTQVFVEQLLDSIPHDDRGNTAVMLQEYIDNSENLRQHGGSLQDKEKLLMELQQLIATIKMGMSKQEKEDIILRRGLLGMFELLARLSIEERKFNDKFSKAATLLRLRLSEEGLERHQDIFHLLDEIQQQQDIVLKEKLLGRFNEMRDGQARTRTSNY